MLKQQTERKQSANRDQPILVPRREMAKAFIRESSARFGYANSMCAREAQGLNAIDCHRQQRRACRQPTQKPQPKIGYANVRPEGDRSRESSLSEGQGWKPSASGERIASGAEPRIPVATVAIGLQTKTDPQVTITANLWLEFSEREVAGDLSVIGI